jgi:hypothetical protein
MPQPGRRAGTESRVPQWADFAQTPRFGPGAVATPCCNIVKSRNPYPSVGREYEDPDVVRSNTPKSIM